MDAQAITETNFHLKGQTAFYKGKVRDVYFLDSGKMVMVASDRISAFDVILPKGIPYKGQMLNLIAQHFLEYTKDIVPNWLEACPHPMVAVGKKCEPIRIEMVVRGYLSGHALRTYQSGLRSICGVNLPEGLKAHQKLPAPIITPTTKAEEGHDEDISKAEIIAQGLVEKTLYESLEKISLQLFERGTAMAAERGLILVDTKYEFGLFEGNILLMDEIHTPDSSRYYYKEGFDDCIAKGETPKQLSKEFLREWLISEGFMGKEGQQIPEMTKERVNLISERYLELYEIISGKKLEKNTGNYSVQEIEKSIVAYLN
jgi:phosphoribosylaminoimidazole-succinocarboxamide synthase